MNVPAMPGKHFVTGSFGALRRRLLSNVRGIYDRALSRAAAGGGGSD
jgi:hypothetical protein